MDQPQAVTGFDSAGRERIRAALRRYMQENRIGTPALQYRIIKSDEPRHREIPLSTLQRFVTGKHHTQEHHVALCHAFVKDLPYYGEGRDLAQFAGALAMVFEIPEERIERAMQAQRLSRDIAGRYEVYALLEKEFDLDRKGTWTRTGFDVPYAEITFEAAPDENHLRVRESVFNPERAHPFDKGKAGTRLPYEGAFISLDWRGIIVMRNMLTRLPKIYWIRDEKRSAMWGLGSEFSFASDPVLQHFEFILNASRAQKESA